jgi:DNA primase
MNDYYKLLKNVNKIFMTNLRLHETKDKAVSYLKGRDVSGETACTFQLGYAPEEWDIVKGALKANQEKLVELGVLVQKPNKHTYDFYRDRVIFPIRNVDGDIVSFGGRAFGDDMPKYLNGAESPVFNKSDELYGLFESLRVNKTLDRLIIVEGYMDVVSLHQAKVNNAAAVMGTALTPSHLSVIGNYTNELVCCYDGDKAGLRAAIKSSILSLTEPSPVTIKVVILDEGHDPDSFVKAFGKDKFDQIISSASSAEEFLIANILNETSTLLPNYEVIALNKLKELVDMCPCEIQQSSLISSFTKKVDINPFLVESAMHPKLLEAVAPVNQSKPTYIF